MSPTPAAMSVTPAFKGRSLRPVTTKKQVRRYAATFSGRLAVVVIRWASFVLEGCHTALSTGSPNRRRLATAVSQAGTVGKPAAS